MIRVSKIAAFAAVASMLAACGGGQSSSPISALPQANSPALSASGTEVTAALATLNAINSPYVRVLPDGTVLHVHPLPQDQSRSAVASKDQVQYHGGSIVKSATLYAIYWQPAGSFMSPKYQSVINEYFKDIGTTKQYKILTQYYDKSSHILNASTFGGSWTDTSPYPKDFTNGNSGDKDLHQEVLKAVAANHWPAGGIGPTFIIFTASKSPADSWAACAYHGSFVSSASTYVYSIVPYQHDYGVHGCGTPSNVWPNDRDADQTIDTLWHEQAEATSDPDTSGAPNTGGWYSNTTGREIGDICQTSYGKLRSDGSDTTLHDHNYVTQEMWSNLGLTCLQTAK
ncbi:MAG: hypothetical protein M3N13_06900 [Candidatus Eremiobacteraeota bacterium]|nr:hypothetical protein [Candidatus Eremiobacteraeota bacterium]